MATELNEAKIRVVLDLPKEDQPKPGERKEGEKGDGRPPPPGSGADRRRRQAIQEMSFGQLGRAFRAAIMAVPGAGIAIGGFEAVENFGPAAQGFIEGSAPPGVAAVNEGLRTLLASVGVDVPDLADVAKWYRDKKSELQAISKAFDRASGIVFVSGEGTTWTPEMVARLWTGERMMAELESKVAKDIDALKKQTGGKVLGESLRKELESSMRDVGK